MSKPSERIEEIRKTIYGGTNPGARIASRIDAILQYLDEQYEQKQEAPELTKDS